MPGGLARPDKLPGCADNWIIFISGFGVSDAQFIQRCWEDAAGLQAIFPEAEARSGARWVDEGAVVTSAGISAGIDMSLHLVARLEGEDLALRTARQMEYDWQRPDIPSLQ